MTSNRAYAIAYLRELDFGAAIIDYLKKIDATLAPFGGRFLVHGGDVLGLEGEWDGDIVVIEFPDRNAATSWYVSPDYQAILGHRVEHSQSIAAIVDGVPTGYQATDGLSALLASEAL